MSTQFRAPARFARSIPVLAALAAAAGLAPAPATPADCPLSFGQPTLYQFGDPTPYGMMAVDLNTDGVLDLVAVSGNVWVLLGHGDGTFDEAVSYATGADWSVSLAVGDLNGDGKPDLVTANYSGGVSVLLGNGDGTFKTAVKYALTGLPTFVAMDDLNGDGKLDLVTAISTGWVSISLGKGDGTFKKEVKYGADGSPQCVAIGDLNSDGKLDLVTVNSGIPSTYSVLLGKGDGTFDTAENHVSSSWPTFVTIADFNGDGKRDLALVGDKGVAVLLGRNNGTFDDPVEYDALYLYSMAIGDLDGDGELDLAASNYYDLPYVFLGNGDGSFQAGFKVSIAIPSYSLAIGDLNSDGMRDLAVGWESGAAVVGLNQGPLVITQQPVTHQVIEGGNTTFSATASYGVTSYQWRLHGNPLADGGPFSGVTTDTLTISGATVFEAGAYDVVAYAGSCETVSAPAGLYVLPYRRGDMNGDGSVDFNDIDGFIECLINGGCD